MVVLSRRIKKLSVIVSQSVQREGELDITQRPAKEPTYTWEHTDMPSPAPLHRALILAAALALAACLGPATAMAQTDDNTVTLDIGKALEEAAAAEKAFQEEMKDNPAYQHREKGDAFLAEKRFDEAIAEYDAVIKISPDDQTIYVQKGIALNGKRRPDLAIPLFDEAIALNVRGEIWAWWPLKHKGDALFLAGQFDKSIAAYTAAIELNPTTGLFANRGQSYVKTRALDNALADFQKASGKSPNWSYPWMMQAVLYAMIAQRDSDLAAADKACEIAAKACNLGDCRPAEQFKSICPH